SYAGAIGRRLGVQYGVAEAIRKLRARGLVEFDHEESGQRRGGPRVFVRAVAGAAPARASRELAAPRGPEDFGDESAPGVCDRLAADVAELRHTYEGVEFEALLMGNRGLGTW